MRRSLSLVIKNTDCGRVADEVDVANADEVNVQAGSKTEIFFELAMILRLDHFDVFVAHVLMEFLFENQPAVQQESRQENNGANNSRFPVPSRDSHDEAQ